MERVLVTGSSGFIGTNVLEALADSGRVVLGVDTRKPQLACHVSVFRQADILDFAALRKIFHEFLPTSVVHLAARTDLGGRDLNAYAANIQGVANLINCVSIQRSVQKCIFTSTKLVCPTDYCPISDDDYAPTTPYGQSKMIGEKLVRDAVSMGCTWCIVRPTSIWGPWSNSAHIPYCRFFRMISRGHYFHPGTADALKSFGYVGNVAFQIIKLLEATPSVIHRRVFYLSDYDPFTICEWANMISMKTRNKPVRRLPDAIAQLLAYGGDVLKICGVREPPISSFRLQNMRLPTACVPLDPIRQITGPLPYTLENACDHTIAWLEDMKLLRHSR